MNKTTSPIVLILIGLIITSCLSSKNLYRSRLISELHQTTWIIQNMVDRTKADTIEFSFGHHSSGEKLNLIAYRSKKNKELCEFRIIKDSIIFESYSTSPPFINIDFSHCSSKSVLIYKNQQLQYVSLVSFCGGIINELLSRPSPLQVRKL